MRTIDQVYLVNNTPLAPATSMASIAIKQPSKSYGDLGVPDSKKSTPIMKRVPKSELELTYMNNPTVFNAINKIVQTIMSAPHDIVAKDKKVQAFFDDFVANLGTSGSDITWDELLSQIYKYQCIYGWAWVENVFNKSGNKIVDWDLIDPKKMDYAKTSAETIALDMYNKPLGYVETLPLSVSVPDPGLPKEYEGNISMPLNSIFLEPDKVSLLKLYMVGDGFYPIGLVEPIYKTSIRKMNIEDALANAIWRHGFPIVLASVGDSNHEPTPQQVKSTLTKLQDISYKQELAVPFYMKVEMLESKKAEKLREHLEYFIQQEVSGMGIPKPYATGGGEETNRATLSNQTEMFMLTLKDIIAKTTYSIQKYMFQPICILEGFKEIPDLRWETIGMTELAQKSKRLLEYVNAGILTADEVRSLIKKFEKLDNE